MYIIIPARLESSRVKDKLLRKVNGKEVLGHVIEASLSAKNQDSFTADCGFTKLNISKVAVCTSSPAIATYVENNYQEVDVLFTTCDDHNSKDYVNGTERCWAYSVHRGLSPSQAVINVQGDSIGITPEVILRMVELVKNGHGHTKASTMYALRENLQPGDLEDDSVVKVVVDKNSNALFFTRMPHTASYRHCGIYGYYVAFLNRYIDMKAELENAESLEQMRTLEYGMTVHCPKLPGSMSAGKSINVEKDLE